MATPIHQLQHLLDTRPQKNMSDMIYEKISQLIQSGEFPEGYVFPNESALCEMLSVGRSTIREAYKALELSGFVTRTKRGTTVIHATDPLNRRRNNADALTNLAKYRADHVPYALNDTLYIWKCCRKGICQ